jgi:hypothetical protein
LYESVYVCSNGYLDFTSSSSADLNSSEAFKTRVMIAPLWDDLITNGFAQGGEDIYIHFPNYECVCFRWAGEHRETGEPVNVEIFLYWDGRIKFNYGTGNTNLSPTIGISGGNGDQYCLASYDGATDLNRFKSVLFTPEEGLITFDLEPPEPPSDKKSAPAGGGGGGGGGCFIATAAFGSPSERCVNILRNFRDVYLLPTAAGRFFVDAYYRYSPPVADFIARHASVRLAVRWGLWPVVGACWLTLRYGLWIWGGFIVLALGLMRFCKGRRLFYLNSFSQLRY